MTRARNIAGFSTITTTPSPIHVGPIGVLTATRIDGEFNVVDIASRDITAQGIGVTNLQVSGITTGLNVSGIITAQNGINFNGTSTGLNVSGVGTIATLDVNGNGDISGNLNVGGVLTYEDVTNVDSVGIITARKGIVSSGVVTATSFVGNGSALTGITQTTINNNADNRVITGSGSANTLEGEATLTYNGTDTFELQPASATPAIFIGDSNRTGAGQGLAQFRGNWNGTTVARITFDAGDDTTNKDDGIIRFDTAPSGSLVERVRIESSGNVGIATDSASKKLDIATEASSDGIRIRSKGNTYNELTFDANRTSANTHLGRIISYWNGTAVSYISMDSGSDTTNKDDGIIRFWTSDGSGATERLRINPTGQVGINQTPDASGGLVQIRYNEVYTSGTTNLLTSAAKAALRIRTSSDSSKSLYFGGVDESATPYLQTGNMSSASGGATASYPMVLNPYGGQVVIGSVTSNSSDRFTIIDPGNAFMSIRSDAQADGNNQTLDFAVGVSNRSSGNLTASIGAEIPSGSTSGGTLKGLLKFSTNSGDSLSERMRISESGNVGINATNPTAKLLIVDSSATETKILAIRNYKSSVNTKPSMDFEASTSSGQGGTSTIQGLAGTDAGGAANQNDSGMKFIVRYGGSGTEREAYTIKNDGNIHFPNGQGIHFGASSGGNSTNELLDDYEEGTFTFTFSGGINITNNEMQYTRVGRTVFCSGRLDMATSGSNTLFQMDGLPFTPDTNHGNSCQGGVVPEHNMGSEGPMIMAVECNTNKVRVRNGSSTAQTIANMSGHQIRFCLTYTTSS